MNTFSELIVNESWSEVDEANTADQKYNKFEEIYKTYYDASFELKSVRRKNQRKNPKPWILPWL